MSYFIDQQRRKLGRAMDRRRLRNRDFTLISNDCWGGEVYKHLDLPFNSPFIGLMLIAPCYVQLLSRPAHYLAQPLEFQAGSRYPEINELRTSWAHYFPIATLGGDVEIQFLHYHSDEEAEQKWNRRVARINWQNLFIKFDGGKDEATPGLVRQFDQLPYPRLTLLREPQPGVASAVVVPDYNRDAVQQFARSLPHVDVVGWLNGGGVHPSAAVRLYRQLLFPVAR